jgi:hypothetical protein
LKVAKNQIKVVHSKYWRSDHFTFEYLYYFEVEATPEWREAFLKEKKLILVPTASAMSYRSTTHSDATPSWFAPEPVDLYDTYDLPGYPGSVWINKSNGHIFFEEAHL